MHHSAGRISTVAPMVLSPLRLRLLVLVFTLAGYAQARAPDDPPTVDYQRDIRPILSDRCYTCHGPDAATREVDLRFDLRRSAVDFGALVPGEPDESSLFDRIAAEDPDERMPPPGANRPALTPDQVEAFRRWIAQGAPFDLHWGELRRRDGAITKP